MAKVTKKRTLRTFPIVGMGASAGGLEAISQVLAELPANLKLAIIVVQHLDPTHKSLLVKILSKISKLPVLEVKDGIPLEAGKVYVAPPHTQVRLNHGVLNLLASELKQKPSSTIDYFFQSLARDHKSKSVGIILSGNGSDGTLGLKEIRTHRGLTLAQDPTTAQHQEMSQSAIEAGMADLILSPQKIGRKLVEIAQLQGLKLPQKITPALKPKTPPQEASDLDAIFSLLKSQFQADFSHYKQTTLRRRIERRMAIQKKETMKEYLQFLQSQPQELKKLFDDLLIRVTEFFRDPRSFEALKQKVLSKIVKNKAPGTPIRVWILGCATGEEAYSVTMSLVETLEELGKKAPIQIFATDLSEAAIQKARAGIYPPSIRKNVSEERLSRFFTLHEQSYKVKKEIREICLFSRHDVTLDPPFVRLDLICCRNLLIYFDSDLQKRILPLLLYALNPKGFLWLGRSESVGRLAPLFRVADKTHRFYFRDKDQVVPRLEFPTRTLWAGKHELSTSRPAGSSWDESRIQQNVEELLLTEYAPPGVVINSRNEIIMARGNTSPYLQLPSGTASLNLFKMARLELISELRMAIQAAKKKGSPIRKKGIALVDGERKKFVTLSIFPFAQKEKPQKQEFLVLFEKIGTAETLITKKEGKFKLSSALTLFKNSRIRELEEELAEAKTYQQTVSDDFEANQEEITSTNEELQSANEELQSTIEELETAKEELQSTNEEVSSINEELRNRNSELLELSNDLANLFGNVDLPIVMVGPDGRVRRFTPRASQYFNLIPTDIGRPIGDVKPNFQGPELSQLVTQVTEALTPQEHEIRNSEGRWFRLQVRPYKTADHRIEGAVISLIDITALKQTLIESQTALRYAASVADTFPLPLVVLDESLRILSVNQEFSRAFDFDPNQELGSDFLTTIGDGAQRIPDLIDRLKEVLAADKPLSHFEVTYDFFKQGRRVILFSAQQIRWQDPLPKAILVSMEDISNRRNLEKDLLSSQERFRLLIESAQDAILIIDSNGKIEFANAQANHWFGYSAGELIHLDVETLVPDRFRSQHISYRETYLKSPEPRTMTSRTELWGRRKDGSEFPVEISLSPIYFNHEVRIAAIVRDVTEARRLLDEKKALFEQEKMAHADAEHARAEAVRANEAKDVFLAILSHELRTPLTSILVWAQLLKRGPIDVEKIKRGLDTIEQSAQAQGQLINDLLDMSRIQSGKLSLTLNTIDPAQIVRAAIESARPLAAAKKINIEMIDQLPSGKLHGDSGRIQQILWNLLNNAIKFSPESSRIEVLISQTKEQARNYVMLQVIDHGRGIDPKFLPYLFTRFSQQDSTLTRLHGGLGIGLALVQDLAKAHGGYVEAASNGPEQGAQFTVYLPLLRERPEIPHQKNELIQEDEMPAPDLSGLRIIIVDDEPSSLEAFVEVIQSFGGVPIPCSSAKEAWKALQNNQPHILVSDIAMPTEDGYSLIQRVRSLSPSQGGKIPAIALTAFAANHDIERVLEAGYQTHLAKPVSSYDLCRTILRLTRKSG